MRDYYDILGEQVVGEMAQPIGFDWGALVNATAGVIKTGVEQKQAGDAEKKAKSDSDAAVAKAINADAQWQNAEANLELAQKDAVAKAAATIQRNRWYAEATTAGAALQGDGILKRCKAANDAMSNAMSAASAAPKDIAKQAKLHAWQKVVSACEAVPKPATDSGDKPADTALVKTESSGSWITAKKAGLPVWGWGLVGVGGLGALILVIRMMRSKK